MSESHGSSFAALLRHHRDLASLTQEELAEKARLSQRSISDIERGVSRAPYQSTVRRLADVLQLGDADRAEFQARARTRGPVAHIDKTGAQQRSTRSSPLIGREREEADILHMLRFESARLVTITGSGGTGKSRLALVLMDRLAHDFASIHFVSLESARVETEMGMTSADAFDIPGFRNIAIDASITRRLSQDQTLMVLDCVDMVSNAGVIVDGLLAKYPNMCVIATSRSALGIPQEIEFSLSPLAVPDPLHSLPLERVREYPAIRLFNRYAHAARPSFRLTQSNADAVVDICRLLRGLPLALELAAARLHGYHILELCHRLSRELHHSADMESEGASNQGVMHATIAWSYGLLSPELQYFFRRLAVFSAGETEDAVTQALHWDQSRDMLESLIETGLAERTITPAGETLYSLPHSIREFALAQLASDPEEHRSAFERYASGRA